MGVTLGNIPCVEPMRVYESCRNQQLPVDWLGKPNSMRVGLRDPGQGWLLMARGDIATLLAGGTNAFDLTFTSPGGQQTFKNLCIVNARAIMPSSRGNPGIPYLVEISDRRYVYQDIAIDKAYNLASPLDGSLYAATKNSGSAWTWDQIAQDLWNAVGASLLGTYTTGGPPSGTLPFLPNGTPGPFNFYGGNAWLALRSFLDRLGCALKLDPTTDTFSIVQLGDPDAVETAAEATWDSNRLWDDDTIEPADVLLVEKVRVLFPIYPAPTDGTSPWYHVDNTDPSAVPGFLTGTTVVLQDDMVALGSSPSNASALSTRAAERTADWFRIQENAYAPKLRRVYQQFFPEPGFLPGALLSEAGLEDRGKGPKTTVVRRADVPDPRQVWKAATIPPFAGCFVTDVSCSGGSLVVTKNC